ncbi:periplasmic heavy metal sensor [Paucibacter sp. APW11]|uniref:Periplasmic heavy metal sensor n=1 Tax=Roseateles aquae TaxID=3077235 RepID=A0ABU3PH58_9BURK|nr:periplasmic heavy metal sensor [Paucibacter sp. APW11]MDT9001907.1 periplasmic heavy metal sensor [Paucibacter sp. APW11]
MNSPTPSSAFTRRFGWLTRKTVIAFASGALMASGLAAVAGEGMPAMHAHMAASASTPQGAAAHADKMLKHLYAEIDATPAQQAAIGPLVKQAVQDLFPLRQQAHSAHAQALQLVQQTPIDRAALENARQQHLQLADQASRRLVQLIADIGDQLTPAQRQQLVQHINKMHGMKHGMQHG